MANYQIPDKESSCEIEVKRSRFLAFANHTPSIQAAKDYIQTLKERYPDARHHCYGFIAGAPWNSNLYGYSDDNEPSGTAGMPIFSHLKHSNIGEITIVVVRYFGGTKLGTGGLSRAYADAAKAVISQLTLKEFVEMETINLKLEFAQEAEIRKKVAQVGGQIVKVQYHQNVIMTIETPKDSDLELPYSIVPSRSTI